MSKYLLIKYFIEPILSFLMIVILFPLFLVIVLLYFPKFDFLFVQERIGFRGKVFKMYKFRTMHRNNNNEFHSSFTLGKWLRKSSLDELPQLFNVFKGEMSLVGPRPLLTEYALFYTSEENRRHEVKPGITGWAQVNGRNNIGWENKFNLDLYYVKHCSFNLDLVVIIRTFKTLFMKNKNGNQKKFFRKL